MSYVVASIAGPREVYCDDTCSGIIMNCINCRWEDCWLQAHFERAATGKNTASYKTLLSSWKTSLSLQVTIQLPFNILLRRLRGVQITFYGKIKVMLYKFRTSSFTTVYLVAAKSHFNQTINNFYLHTIKMYQ